MAKMTQAQQMPTLATNVLDIPLAQVVRGKNVRTVEIKPDRFEEMCESIKKNGQMTPVEVQKRPDGKYDLIAGFTRTAALEKLGAETVRAQVQEAPAKDPDKHRKLRGLAENLAREDLTPYDQAMSFQDLKKNHDMSGVSIGQYVGRSTSYVNNLMRIADSCEPVILERWKKECDPNFGRDKEGKKLPNVHQVCTMDWLTKLAADVPRAEQEMALKKAMGLIPDEEDEEDEDDESGESNPKDPGAKRASLKSLKEAIAAAVEKEKEAKGEEKARIKGILQGLRFATGSNVSIKDVFQPKAKE